MLCDRFGYKRMCRELGISRSSMHRYVRGIRRNPDAVVERCLNYVGEDELAEILGLVRCLE